MDNIEKKIAKLNKLIQEIENDKNFSLMYYDSTLQDVLSNAQEGYYNITKILLCKELIEHLKKGGKEHCFFVKKIMFFKKEMASSEGNFPLQIDSQVLLDLLQYTLFDIEVSEEFVIKHNESKNNFKFEVKEIDGYLYLSERIEFKPLDFELPKHPPISIRTNE